MCKPSDSQVSILANLLPYCVNGSAYVTNPAKFSNNVGVYQAEVGNLVQLLSQSMVSEADCLALWTDFYTKLVWFYS